MHTNIHENIIDFELVNSTYGARRKNLALGGRKTGTATTIYNFSEARISSIKNFSRSARG